MVEEVCPDLFSIKVPLPDSPLKFLNAYVVRSPGQNLLIDTGFNNKVCFDAIMTGLNALGIRLIDTDIFVTHFHADHFSLVPKLKTETTRIYFNRPEAELLENWQGFGKMLENAGNQGFPKEKLKSALAAHPGSKFGVEWAPEAKFLSEGQTLTYGDYTFTCIETPGHTLGHICLYDPSKKVFISGDHVLIDISPNIQCWNDYENPLKNYINSLKKIREFDVDIVLPGHRRRFTDLKSRVDELILHHEERLDEICNIIENAPQSAYKVAGQMKWDIKAASWNEFPIAQQWFATGEALSHLRYLEEERSISRQVIENNVRFALTKGDMVTG